EDELGSYIEHRLAISRSPDSSMPGAGELARALGDWEGAGGVTFTPDAVQSIWHWSGGLPRVVNLLCDRALETGCAQRLHTVNTDLVDSAAGALDLRAKPAEVPAAPVVHEVDVRVATTPAVVESAARTAPRRKKRIAAAIALLAAAAIAAWFVTRAASNATDGSHPAPSGGLTSMPAPTVAPSKPAQTVAPS